MADKEIVALPESTGVTDETLIPVYQPGAVDPAQKMTGAQFRAFAEAVGALAGELAAAMLQKGATFTPAFDPATGILSWTNDSGLPNPDPVQLGGVTSFNGRSGSITPQSGDYTAADVGAIPAITVYYSADMSADDLVVPLALIPVSTSLNSELHAIVLGGYAYVLTLFYQSVSTTSRRMQLGFSYHTDTPKMAFRIYNANGWTTWRVFAYADYAVNKAGDTMTGVLSFRPSGVAGYSQLYKNASADGDYGTLLTDRDANGNLAALKIDASRSYARFVLGSTEHDILHTGNKPSGSYTGNGDATARTIDTGGVGSVVAIWSGTQVALLTANGGFNFSSSSNTVTGVANAAARFTNGKIVIATTANSVNANGIEYNYQVL